MVAVTPGGGGGGGNVIAGTGIIRNKMIVTENITVLILPLLFKMIY
jgi:hypothetical protein